MFSFKMILNLSCVILFCLFDFLLHKNSKRPYCSLSKNPVLLALPVNMPFNFQSKALVGTITPVKQTDGQTYTYPGSVYNPGYNQGNYFTNNDQ